FVAASLREGMVGVAVPIRAAQMAGGFVGPGDYVDVILTYSKRLRYQGVTDPAVLNMLALNMNRYATETVLQNVRVLAVDQSARRDDEKPVRVGKTITLEVD